MNTLKNNLLITVLLSSAFPLYSVDPFAAMINDMHESFRRMDESFKNMRHAMQEGLTEMNGGFKTQLSIKPEKDGIIITAHDIETQKIDASINDAADNLTVKTDNGNIIIDNQNAMLSVYFEHQEQDNREQPQVIPSRQTSLDKEAITPDEDQEESLIPNKKSRKLEDLDQDIDKGINNANTEDQEDDAEDKEALIPKRKFKKIRDKSNTNTQSTQQSSDDQSAQESSSYRSYYSHAQSYQTIIDQELDFNNSSLKVDYNKQTKTLTIEIPYKKQPEEQRKNVPVNIK